MAPRKAGHEWTAFEIRTLICLLARSIHIPNVRKGETVAQAYLTVTTELNVALNGGHKDFDLDIPFRDVSIKIDELLENNPHAAEIMRRSQSGRVTRRLVLSWRRALQTLELRLARAREEEQLEQERLKETERLEKERLETLQQESETGFLAFEAEFQSSQESNMSIQDSGYVTEQTRF